MIFKFDKDLFEKCKTNCLSRPNLIKNVPVHLQTLPEDFKCTECYNTLKLNMDNSKSLTVGYRFEICRKRYDSRKYAPFAPFRLSAAEILQIIFYL